MISTERTKEFPLAGPLLRAVRFLLRALAAVIPHNGAQSTALITSQSVGICSGVNGGGTARNPVKAHHKLYSRTSLRGVSAPGVLWNKSDMNR